MKKKKKTLTSWSSLKGYSVFWNVSKSRFLHCSLVQDVTYTWRKLVQKVFKEFVSFDWLHLCLRWFPRVRECGLRRRLWEFVMWCGWSAICQVNCNFLRRRLSFETGITNSVFPGSQSLSPSSCFSHFRRLSAVISKFRWICVKEAFV